MDVEGQILARRVAEAADAWLRDPLDGGVYARLVAATLAWRAYAAPAVRGTSALREPGSPDDVGGGVRGGGDGDVGDVGDGAGVRGGDGGDVVGDGAGVRGGDGGDVVGDGAGVRGGDGGDVVGDGSGDDGDGSGDDPPIPAERAPRRLGGALADVANQLRARGLTVAPAEARPVERATQGEAGPVETPASTGTAGLET